jgi:hypothetical protein
MRVVRAMRAFFSAFAFLGRRHPVVVILVLFALVGYVVLVYSVATAPPPPAETPQQRQARVAAEDERNAKRSAEKERTKFLCAVKSACSKYAEARQECAVAGNFDNCLQVKMGSEDYALKDSCTEDGKLAGVSPSDIPDPVSCFIARL